MTATTLLVALVAMAAAGHPGRALEVESPVEGHVVRVVAAAVVARMRELLASEHPTAAVTVLEVCVQTRRPAVSRVAASRCSYAGPTLLGERLLDLPPPAC